MRGDGGEMAGRWRGSTLPSRVSGEREMTSAGGGSGVAVTRGRRRRRSVHHRSCGAALENKQQHDQWFNR
eukprot:3845077-Pyramimonas_sp.AAC.1